MDETIKLYDKDAYATKFEAVVISCTAKGEEFEIVLDQTLFFPEEGGQTCDRGLIERVPVLDVQIRDHVIYHTVSSPIKEETIIHGEIDWTHRFNNMQQHSGEHIFSGLVHNKFGYDNVGFHLSDQTVTMDFNGVLTKEEAAELEKEANKAIFSNLPICISYPSKIELETMNYRSKIEIEGQVRLVSIPGVDVCACCAPHVKTTGEIGLLKIMSLQNYKGGVRLSILCGYRALADYCERVDILTSVTNALSIGQDTLYETVTKLKESNLTLKNQLVAANQQILATKITQIPKDKKHVFLFEEELDAPIMRTAVNNLVKEHSGYCGIFSGNETLGYRYIIGSKEMDSTQPNQLLREAFQAKGGGNKAMVQGSLTAKQDDIKKVLERLE